MREAFVQFVWQNGYFNFSNLRTTQGEALEIVYPGSINRFSGPDFSDARVRIDQTLWAGQVEIHVKSSDWLKHGHQTDNAYNSVVLHVVYEHDTEVRTQNDSVPPTLELKGLISKKIFDNYLGLQNSRNTIPCAHAVEDVPNIVKSAWLDRVMIQRLERKSNDLQKLYLDSGNDLQQTFHVCLSGYLGQNVNRGCFESLAKSLPVKLLLKHSNQSKQVEALLFGMAGLIDVSSSYGLELHQEFNFLKNKYGLTPVPCLWKFGGVRPPSFPTRRLAILSAWVPLFQALLSSIDQGELENWKKILDGAELSTYWQRRYQFGKASSQNLSILTKGLRQTIGVNVIAPFLFLRGQQKDDDGLKEKAIELLEEMKPEENYIIQKWKSLSVEPENASQSQALIELRTNFCDAKKCVHCGIGQSILNR